MTSEQLVAAFVAAGLDTQEKVQAFLTQMLGVGQALANSGTDAAALEAFIALGKPVLQARALEFQIKQKTTALETLIAEKNAEITALRQQIAQLEQTTGV